MSPHSDERRRQELESLQERLSPDGPVLDGERRRPGAQASAAPVERDFTLRELRAL